MDKTINTLPVFHETRFRVPGRYEQQCGFWVDRIGSGRATHQRAPGLRVLGQYAAVTIESGDGVFLSATRGVQSVRPGDMLLLTPQAPCFYTPNATWFSRWVVWNGPAAHQAAEACSLASLDPVCCGVAAPVREAFFALVRLMDAEDAAACMERQAVILNMLAGILKGRRAAERLSSAPPDLEPVIRHIRTHLNASLAVSDLAALCHLSVPHFRRLFHRHTGRSPMAFIAAQRMARAKEWLERGASIKQVAAETGFDDPLYFMRMFKKITGQTAGEFRAAVRTAPGG